MDNSIEASGTSAAAPAPAAPAPGRGAAAILIAMCLGLMLTMFNGTLVNVTLPDIAHSLHVSSTGLQWISAIYTLCYAAMLLPGGALGTRFGRRRTFLVGVGIFILGSICCALAPGLGLLLAARFVQAIGGATLLPQTLAIIVREYAEPNARARAVGIWAGVASLGLAAGPVVGGALLTVASWRAGFLLSIVLGLITLVLAWVAVPSARHGQATDAVPIDLPGAVLSVVALAGLVFGLIESGNFGWGSPIIIGSFAVFVLGAAAFLLLESKVRHPIMPLGIWRSRTLIAANLSGLVYFVCFFGILYFFSIDLQEHRHFSALATGLAFLPMLVVMALLGPVAGRLSALRSPATLLVTGLVIAAGGCLLLAFLPAGAALLDVEWRLFIVGIGAGLMSSPMSNLAVSSVSAEHSGIASALHNMSRQVGSTLGVAALGVIVGSTGFAGGLDRAMGVVAVALVAGAIAAFLLTRRVRRTRRP